MPTYALRLHIDPVLGPAGVSCGTVSHIKILREELDVGLAAAKEYVDRCVFGAETVDIPMESLEDAQRIRSRLLELDHLPPTTTVRLVVDGELAEEANGDA